MSNKIIGFTSEEQKASMKKNKPKKYARWIGKYGEDIKKASAKKVKKEKE